MLMVLKNGLPDEPEISSGTGSGSFDALTIGNETHAHLLAESPETLNVLDHANLAVQDAAVIIKHNYIVICKNLQAGGYLDKDRSVPPYLLGMGLPFPRETDPPDYAPDTRTICSLFRSLMFMVGDERISGWETRCREVFAGYFPVGNRFLSGPAEYDWLKNEVEPFILQFVVGEPGGSANKYMVRTLVAPHI